jgi:hypothetical protein
MPLADEMETIDTQGADPGNTQVDAGEQAIEGQLILTQNAQMQYELLVEGQPLELWVDYLQRFVAGRVKTKARGNQEFSADPGQPTRLGYHRLLRPGMWVRLRPSDRGEDQVEADLVAHLRGRLGAYRGRSLTLSYLLYELKAESVAWLRGHTDAPNRLSQEQVTVLIVKALCEAGVCII